CLAAILATVRQKIHLSQCLVLPGHLCVVADFGFRRDQSLWRLRTLAGLADVLVVFFSWSSSVFVFVL
ncbi:hypothetical protein LL253_10330, partial [Sphingobium soli]